MTLTDTGPLVALVINTDPDHAKCKGALAQLPSGPLLTTWPCYTEAMYLVFRSGGIAGQLALWRIWAAGRLVFHELTPPDCDRMAALMDQYRNVPMDLADASIVAAAEARGFRKVFALDTDFLIYRLTDGSALQMVP